MFELSCCTPRRGGGQSLWASLPSTESFFAALALDVSHAAKSTVEAVESKEAAKAAAAEQHRAAAAAAAAAEATPSTASAMASEHEGAGPSTRPSWPRPPSLRAEDGW